MNTIITYILLAMSFISCTTSKHEQNKIMVLEPIDSMHSAIISDNHQLFIFKPVQNEYCLNCTYMVHRKKCDTLYLFNFDLGKVVSKTPLPADITQIDDYLIDNDTFYGISHTRFIQVFDLKISQNDSVKRYTLKDYSLVIALYLNKESDGFHINIMKSDLINTAEKLSSFYEGFVDAKVKLDGDSVLIIEKSINYPKHYPKYCNLNFTFLSSTVSPQATLFSFANEPNVLVKRKNKSFENAKMTTNFYIKSPPIDKDKALNEKYLEKIKYTDFLNVIFNPYRNEYYRIAIHPSKVYNKIPFSNPWSLIVADSLLKTKYEIYYEDGQPYIYSKLIATQKGFAVPVFSGDFDTKEELILHEFELD